MLLSILTAFICWVGLAWAAWRLACNLLPDERASVRWSAAGIIGISFIVVLCELFGSFGILRRGAVVPATALLAIVAALLPRQTHLANDLRLVSAWTRHRLREGYALFFCVAALPVAQAVMRAIRCPPLSWDSLGYHAFLPARWVQLGALTPFAAPGGMDTYRAYPINFELLVAWAILPFGTDLAVNLVNLPVMFLGAVALYGLARELNAPPRLALWAPAIFCLAPPLWSLITTQYSDIMLASTMVAGLLFLVRYFKNGSSRELLFAAAGFGMSVGTRYSAFFMAAACWIVILALHLLQRPRGLRSFCWPGAALALAFLLGGYQYVRNWIELGNPVYPVGLSIGGVEVFRQSPHFDEVFRRYPLTGRRDADWAHFKGLFAAGPFSWGLVFAGVWLAALWAAVRPSRQRLAKWLLTFLWLSAIVLFYASDAGLAAHVRRLWPEVSQRLLAPAMATAVCLAISGSWLAALPRTLVAVLPTMAVLADYWCGNYPQPLSFGETAAIVTTVVVACWWLSRRGLDRLVTMLRTRPAWVVAGVVLLLALAAAGAGRLQVRRDDARYYHYAHSTDYHEIPREFVPAWQACDEAASPHVVAMTRNRTGTGRLSLMSTGTRWFFYPLLGSRFQNRVVYASIHEMSDVPSPPYFSGLSEDGNETMWLRNLARLGVDRLFVGEEARPEEGWIAGRPDVFIPINEGPGYRLYGVEPAGLTRSIQEAGQ